MYDRRKDVLVRACKTFFQALLATAIAQLLAIVEAGGVTPDPKALITAVCIPALAGGLSAIQNILFPPATQGCDKEVEHGEDCFDDED